LIGGRVFDLGNVYVMCLENGFELIDGGSQWCHEL
jgi:hypothetical protein